MLLSGLLDHLDLELVFLTMPFLAKPRPVGKAIETAMAASDPTIDATLAMILLLRKKMSQVAEFGSTRRSVKAQPFQWIARDRIFLTVPFSWRRPAPLGEAIETAMSASDPTIDAILGMVLLLRNKMSLVPDCRMTRPSVKV